MDATALLRSFIRQHAEPRRARVQLGLQRRFPTRRESAAHTSRSGGRDPPGLADGSAAAAHAACAQVLPAAHRRAAELTAAGRASQRRLAAHCRRDCGRPGADLGVRPHPAYGHSSRTRALTCARASPRSWGKCGQLGHGTAASEEYPRDVEALHAHRIVSASAGGAHSAFVSDDGRMFGCGDHTYGQLGFAEPGFEAERTVPGQVPVPRPQFVLLPTALDLRDADGAAVEVARVSCGGQHTLVLAGAPSALSWLVLASRPGVAPCRRSASP